MTLVRHSPLLTLAWALAASLAVHVGIVVGRRSPAARAPASPRSSRAPSSPTLTPAQVPAAEPVVASPPAPSVLDGRHPGPVAPRPRSAPLLPHRPRQSRRREARRRGSAKLEVDGRAAHRQEPAGRSHVAADDRVSGRDRPAGAPRREDRRPLSGRRRCRAGPRGCRWRCGSIVDAAGHRRRNPRSSTATEEFASEVLAAIRAARFLPAQDNLKPIRYPIALEFRFRTGAGATAGAAAEGEVTRVRLPHHRHVEPRRGAAVVGPARRHRLAARVEAHAVHAVHVQVAEQRVAPAAERDRTPSAPGSAR